MTEIELVRNQAKAVAVLLVSHPFREATSESTSALRILWVALNAAHYFPGIMPVMPVLVHL